MEANMLIGEGSSLQQKSVCNSRELFAIIDTGVSVSVVNAALVRKFNWRIEQDRVQLVHAAGESLSIILIVAIALSLVYAVVI